MSNVHAMGVDHVYLQALSVPVENVYGNDLHQLDVPSCQGSLYTHQPTAKFCSIGPPCRTILPSAAMNDSSLSPGALVQAEINPGNCACWYIRCTYVTLLSSRLTNLMTAAYNIPPRPSLRPSCSEIRVHYL